MKCTNPARDKCPNYSEGRCTISDACPFQKLSKDPKERLQDLQQKDDNLRTLILHGKVEGATKDEIREAKNERIQIEKEICRLETRLEEGKECLTV